MHIVTNVKDLRTLVSHWQQAHEAIALVPTMGALHRGHMALVKAARASHQRIVASIFVNPLQFAPHEDLSKYPRQLEADQKLLTDHGCDVLYAPSADEMYPAGFDVTILPGSLAQPLEGAFRPSHFAGVATVVSKLLLQVMPTTAFFGEKDYQQLQVIRHVVKDLNIPCAIQGVPIVRDEDGLALSSRNIYLSSDERQRALTLPTTLHKAKQQLIKGEKSALILQTALYDLTAVGFDVDYVELVDAETLAPVYDLSVPARLLAAARIGSTRLIDNLAVNY